MTPIFLVLLVAIDPIIAQNGGNISDSQYITYMTNPPTILVRPQSQQVKAGGIASFFCTAQGAPPPQIHWRKNGKRISQSQSRYLVHTYEHGALLRIEPVKTARDSTTYECVAENGVGDAVSAEAQLTVYEAENLPAGFPMITQAPAAKVVEMGHNAVLLCGAIGSPTPIISWVRNMLPMDTSNPRFTVLDSGTLQITNSISSDQAKYECVANNSVGTEYSKSTLLYVKVRRVAPSFSIPPPTLSEVTLGASLNLNCVAVGAPMPVVQWRKYPATDIMPDDNLPVGKNVLYLTDIQESANYTCTASSPIGVIHATSMVKVQSLPGPPENIQVSDITATSVKLSWSYKGPDELQYYVIQHKPKQANQPFTEISGITTMYYHVRGLSPYTEYELYVIAVNHIGRGPPSAPVTVTTGETTESTNGGAKPGTAPRKVQVRPLSSSTMVIQWDEPETPNGQVTGYKVYYTMDPNQPMASWQFQMVDNSQLTTLSDLTPHTIYTIRVQALTSVGPGPLSAPIQIKTQQGVPSQPEMLTVVDVGETKVTLRWSKPAHSSENILSYELYWNDTYAKEKHHRRIPVTENYTLTGLYPNTLYYIWLAARSQRGEGATTIPCPVRTKQYVPGAPPRNVTGQAISPTSILVTWEPPPAERSNGRISYYRLQVVESGRSDSEAKVIKLNQTRFVLDELKKWTEYRIWVLAGTSVGDGPPSYPISVRTHEDDDKMPGDPQNVKVTSINSTAIHVEWDPPKAKDQNGVIRGYHIHVQEVREEGRDDVFNEPIRRDVQEDGVREINITGLQPDTRYSVQIAALTRKGDGDRSAPVHVRTPGGVPNRPQVNIKVLSRDPVVLELEWMEPTQTYGDLLGYRIRYGIKNQTLKKEFIRGTRQHTYKITDLEERGVEYEFRVAGQNSIGYGQETVQYWSSPEGEPSGSPTNLSYFFQTPDTLCVTWDKPLRQHRNGQIIGYDVQFNKKNDHSSIIERNTTKTREVFSNLEEDTEYVFHVRARTMRGSGPYSEKITIITEKDIGRAPMFVKAVATSESSVEVWWEPVPNRGKIVGYQVFYTTTPVEDLDEWKQKTVGLTESTDLVNLEKFTQYAITVAARYKTGLGRISQKITVTVKPEDVPLNLRAPESSTHSMTLSWTPPIRLNPTNYKVSFDAVKEFVDSQGITQTQIVQRRQILFDPSVTSTTINELQPFTTYNVNVSAVPRDGQYRPPAKITVTTQMAAPKPMVKPDFYGVVNGEEIQVILPQASEEYGPISHYYLIVVPEDKSTADKQPDELTEDIITGKSAKQERENAPYIAAKFPHRDIPYTFHLGSGDIYEGYENRKLERNKRYRIFVRAVVDTPRKHLYTSSPFSEYLSLDMREVPPGEPPRRPNPNTPVDKNPEVSVKTSGQEPGMVWVIGPIIAALMVSICMVLLFVIKKRRQPCKAPDQAAVTRPLMAADISSNHAPSDPVEMRRLNFQTPGMISHPPIPISELGNHIERLKANDNLKFSQEYESIEPGQQFTWDHSNMEVNASKNRYANVIAYDHSRVILQTVDGMPGSDYINANYCDGYRKQNAYVATQGPLQETFGDFWRMCWELRTSTIVMMTKLEERTRIKCDQYWPTRGSETYGQMTVTITDIQELATYCIRTFQVCRAGYSERREIKQLQFTAWPDHGVPEHPAPFLQFLRRVRSLNVPDSGPLVVHCSAGVGRTGCFIVIDSMLERIKHEKMIDIYGHVTCLRAQRNYMVQTEDQYIFIHDALLEAVICGNTEVPARNLHSHIQKLMQPEIDNITGMELEFKKLSNIKADSTRFISANLPCNKHKNRLVHILPYECSRVCLQPQRNIEGSDYINASLIDGYRYRGAYIATQGPLCDTTDDFWRMLWEHNSTIVVMLTKLKEMGREKCHQYWPSDRSIRYQCFVVDPIAEYNMPQYILREFKVTDARDGASRTVRQFQFIDWPEQGVPKSGDGFIDFIGQVHKTKEQFGQDGPITVHCSAGVGRTGVFITLSIVLERMQYEGVVDIFQTVRILRTQRPAMVQTEDQYQFCYRASLEYLGSFDHYAN
ncbi:tyrosine-protein phosphatase Lar isoform X1 [Vespula pensylvanica]|uniref:tyrosine-protein phosphatase Lar isoform X1 n=2 Tax=Vespula pensylvanica TaxID=30213 RepID=UPI001CBA5DF6|nr:tyrosine-protein phosphatase Lar isoform X1 [Vespula pensylvanica]XP_043676297.1 tyrosine-protein phosphatase Lar isoform X1 [Vespula pensylvanica]XP_043676298.1 tyrosine-protein phosphatase Lar isoform X1 [Vespula pensylvanica]XP_043676299.1 tyrosine-protein phosphatase Lar isoform X1 [Vespula pensylvanica]XP_043676300.1 tyrosine-protein phosphatase Lar isoform X1 [Vespula pensylvanica]